MRRQWLIWYSFAAGLAGVLGAMAWISLTILRLERHTRQREQVDSAVELALWRMDTIAAPLISREAARPYTDYTPATKGKGDYSLQGNDAASDEPAVLLRFQVDPAGKWACPPLPRVRADVLADLRQQITGMASLGLPELTLASPPIQIAGLGNNGLINNSASIVANSEPPLQQPAQQAQISQQNFNPQQNNKAQAEFQARAVNAENTSNFYNRDQNVIRSSHVREGPMIPRWAGGRLLLARRVSVNSVEYAQGVVLDWPAIRRQLLAAVDDLLPNASLEPIIIDSPELLPRRLASLPVRLEPGILAYQPDGAMSPLRVTLGIAWGGVLLGSAAVAGLMWGTLRLGRRREDFVSAVTHELRTPITTLSMYAEMLEEGMIVDETKRRGYLATLRREAERLGRLVENVLAFSRLERGRAGRRIETVTIEQLMQAMWQRMLQRATQAGLEPTLQLPGELASRQITLDPSAVEQILFNLVDNAAKYAVGAADRRVLVGVAASDGSLHISVRDFGPGIAPEQIKTLFRPFSKSARDAANSAPGVGLGLALSRRLARELRGELRFEPDTSPGACFVLTLPMPPREGARRH
ncbi:MAG: HAMP domain-containing sensor histidine kinase [Tepidisphaeraceae bacterium]